MYKHSALSLKIKLLLQNNIIKFTTYKIKLWSISNDLKQNISTIFQFTVLRNKYKPSCIAMSSILTKEFISLKLYKSCRI